MNRLCIPMAIYAMLAFCIHTAQAQYWQQSADYTMDLVFDDSKHQYNGSQRIVYKNNSPDTLYVVYYHLFPNAFQPGSMMDVRSQTIADPDPRVADKISKLKPGEQGFLKVLALSQNGKMLEYQVRETILEAKLAKPIYPGKKARFDMEFHGQVPQQIRRSGRHSREGIAYSMAQWYPKMCEYDRMGWHAYPYIGREFHGVWGSFDVKITLDSAYTLAATGILRNARNIGKGYLPKGKTPKRPEGNMLTWHFVADKVHDFAWAADKDYAHETYQVKDGPLLRFFFKDTPDLHSNWAKLPEYTAQVFTYASEHFGKYPYAEYAVVQGGDGGMEYPMLTLITGQRRLSSLVGVMVHEALHSWYQLVLGSNEALYPWMDEGFTTYAGACVMSHLFNPEEDTRRGGYFNGYLSLALSGMEEPMSKHADHYNTNYAYGAASYNKGGVFVGQLGYVIGDANLKRGLKRYFEEWKFKHPDPVDFIRVMEKTSGLQLYWYLDYMLNTTETIDYGIEGVYADPDSDGLYLALERIGNFPMPIDIDVTMTDGSQYRYHIPLSEMLGSKAAEDDVPYTVLDAWPWTSPGYGFFIDLPLQRISIIEIDASLRLADVDRSNNDVRLNDSPETDEINND